MARDRASIIQRIRACLALADEKKNSNPHERDTAKRAADALIKKHKIHPDELSFTKSSDWDVIASSSTSTIWAGFVPPTTGDRVRAASSEEEVANIFSKSGIKPTERGWGSFTDSTRIRPCDSCTKKNNTVKFYQADEFHGDRYMCGLCMAGED